MCFVPPAAPKARSYEADCSTPATPRYSALIMVASQAMWTPKVASAGAGPSTTLVTASAPHSLDPSAGMGNSPLPHSASTTRSPGGVFDGRTNESRLVLVGSGVTDSGSTAVPLAVTEVRVT